MMSADLMALAERCEDALGPDKILSGEVAVACEILERDRHRPPSV